MPSRTEFSRADRVRKALMRELSDILRREIQDPALENRVVSVTDVDLSKDLRVAKVFLSVLGSPDEQQAVITALMAHVPEIRQEVGARIRLRYTPEIRLSLDDSLERGSRVSALIDKISRGEV